MREKLLSLTKHAQNTKARLTSTTPTKHLHREESYRQMLRKELKLTEDRIEVLKIKVEEEKVRGK